MLRGVFEHPNPFPGYATGSPSLQRSKFRFATSSFTVVSSSCAMASSTIFKTHSVILVRLPDLGKGAIVLWVFMCCSKCYTVWRQVNIPSLARTSTTRLQLKPPDSNCWMRSLAYGDSLGRFVPLAVKVLILKVAKHPSKPT